LDRTSQQHCGRCQKSLPKSKFVQHCQRGHGCRVEVKGASGFSMCRDCSLKDNNRPSKVLQCCNTKAKMANEKLQALTEAQERHGTKGCCNGCTIDLDAWCAHCESHQQQGCGPLETQPERKKSLAADWDHPDPRLKWKNACLIKNDARRLEEINGHAGNPGCRGAQCPVTRRKFGNHSMLQEEDVNLCMPKPEAKLSSCQI